MKRLLLLLLVALANVVHADDIPTTPGPCNDVNECEQACKKGQIVSCVWGGGIAMQDPDNDQMKAQGLAMFDMACVKGHVESCRYLAGIADDDAKARKYYERACNMRDVQSCFELAKLMGAAGDDKSKMATIAIYKKLIGILEPRCDTKEVYACTSLAEVYEQMAIKYRDRACQAETGQPCKQ